VASENFKILNQGLILSVNLQIRHNTWLSNSILIFYVFLSLLILQRSIRKRILETEMEEAAQKRAIERLTKGLEEAETKLREVKQKESEYQRKIEEINREKSELSKDVDGLLEEVEKQETGLQVHRKMKSDLESEILGLTEELRRFKENLSRAKRRRRPLDAAEKRFRVLYKNLSFTERAVEGFLSLTEECQLKAEEMIHRLNEDASLVSVRRKVFGKGGKLDILEADFAYSGRLYFHKDSQSTKTRIVAIGTKNTQERDLNYLESAERH
jgi:phage-related tail protein